MAEPREDPLVAELRGLGARLDVPPAPDLRAAVRARLAAPPPRRRWRWRWRALAAALAIALIVAVVPPARAAVVRLLNFAGVRIEQGHPTPARSPQPLPSLRSAALDEARRLAHFRIGVPAQLGVPDDVQLADPGPDGAPRVVSLLYRARAVRLDEFDGQLDWAYLKTQPAPDFQWVQIHDGSGMWLPTAHSVTYVDRQGQPHTETARLAGPTLIWTDGMVTYRLEGFSTLDQAISVALSVG